MASHGSKTFLLDAQHRPRPPITDPSMRAARPDGPDRHDTARCREVLDQLLRQTVISKLRLAHTQTGTYSATLVSTQADIGQEPDARTDTNVADLARTLCDGSQHAVDDLVEVIVQAYGVESLVLDVMPELDRVLRGRHDAGAATTLGQWRLQEMLERLSARFQGTATVRPHGTRVLLGTPEPQLQRMRLLLAAECLGREGWDVCCDSSDSLDAPATTDLCGLVARAWFAVAVIAAEGLPTDVLAAELRGLRAASCNPRLLVLVISDALGRRPDRMARLGADAAATDLRHACVQAARLRGMLTRSD